MADELKSLEWGKQSSTNVEERFLEGPSTRRSDFLQAIRIFFEFMKGYRNLHFVGPCVTVFGSARFPETNQYYQLARSVGSRLAQLGFTVMTGGGPGIMEAANRGAKDVNGRSVGCNIKLPKEQEPNKFLDKWVEFNHFFIRKVMLLKYSYAYIALPGGFGTLDEVFETATLIQTGKIKNFPILLMGTDYWNPLVEYMQEHLKKRQTISENDLDYFIVTDSLDDMASVIEEYAFNRFGLKRRYRPKRKWFLWER